MQRHTHIRDERPDSSHRPPARAGRVPLRAVAAAATALMAVGLLAGCFPQKTQSSQSTQPPVPTGNATVTLVGESYSFTVSSCNQVGKVLGLQGRPTGASTATLSGIVDVATKQSTLFVSVPDGAGKGAVTQYVGTTAAKKNASISLDLEGKVLSGAGKFSVRDISANGKTTNRTHLVSGTYKIQCGAIVKSTPTAKPKHTSSSNR